ncbi:MAG: hypothetical protein CUN55_10440 [Phototrophicales bacterium]|nr:MAG: hypothetical protein CUN55_10440 [Phototrophicales bacterium]
MAKKNLFFIIAVLLIFTLSACSGDVYNLAYTARGESTNILGLTQTEFFRNNEDLNVVVKLNEHDGVTVGARFIDPKGEQVGNIVETKVSSDVGSVVLGLDYEQLNAGVAEDDIAFWRSGAWKVEILIDGEVVDTLEFDVA